MIVNKNVREYVKLKGLMISEKTMDAIEEEVKSILDKACLRTRAGNRSVIKPRDI